MHEKEYNGWANYETWAVNLWMDQDYWAEETKEVVEACRAEKVSEHNTFTLDQRATLELAGLIKEMHEEGADLALTESSCMKDLLSGALAEVNWLEIAEHLVDQYIEDTQDDLAV